MAHTDSLGRIHDPNDRWRRKAPGLYECWRLPGGGNARVFVGEIVKLDRYWMGIAPDGAYVVMESRGWADRVLGDYAFGGTYASWCKHDHAAAKGSSPHP